MKKFFLISTLLFAFSLCNLLAQDFQIEPQKPVQGELIKVKYNPNGGALEDKELEVTVYALELGELNSALDIDLKKSGDFYVGEMKVPEKGQVLVFKFFNSEYELIETNEDQGYLYKIHKDGKPVEHADAVMASAYSLDARTIGITSNTTKAKKMLAKDIAKSSDNKYHPGYIGIEAAIVTIDEDKEGKEAIIKRITEVAARDNTSEDDILALRRIAENMREDDLSKKVMQMGIAQSPKGKVYKKAMIYEFYDLESLDEKVAHYEMVEKQLGTDKEYENDLDRMERNLVMFFARGKEYEKAQKYASIIGDNLTKARMYNMMAWDLTGGGIDKEGENIKLAEKLSKESLELLKDEKNILAHRPSYITENEWKRSAEYSAAMYSDTYALAAYKVGQTKDALKYQQIACDQYEYRDVEMNERMAIYTEKEKGAKAAISFVAERISEGQANSKMKGHFGKLYKENVNLEEAYNMYLGTLEQKAQEKRVKEITKKLIKKDAPDFTLSNLKGETVSLASLKGKYVVLDFWATWCGPCISSFPGMQKAVNQYADTEDVEFVFVNTWENGDDPKKKEEKVKKFIEDNEYNFNVILDNKSKMVEEYKVEGIPTKFILDKTGQIRYASTGFSGNDDAVINEILTLIEILRKDDASGETSGTQP